MKNKIIWDSAEKKLCQVVDGERKECISIDLFTERDDQDSKKDILNFLISDLFIDGFEVDKALMSEHLDVYNILNDFALAYNAFLDENNLT